MNACFTCENTFSMQHSRSSIRSARDPRRTESSCGSHPTRAHQQLFDGEIQNGNCEIRCEKSSPCEEGASQEGAGGKEGCSKEGASEESRCQESACCEEGSCEEGPGQEAHSQRRFHE